MQLPPKPTVEDVRRHAATHECGRSTAREILMRRWRIDTLHVIRHEAAELYSVEACCAIIKSLLDLMIDNEINPRR